MFIEIKELSKFYNTSLAVNKISFEINKNKENVYLWGDSMAGPLFPGINEKYKKKLTYKLSVIKKQH